MFIEDAKVKELVYSGNTEIFLLPCMRKNGIYYMNIYNIFMKYYRLKNIVYGYRTYIYIYVYHIYIYI